MLRLQLSPRAAPLPQRFEFRIDILWDSNGRYARPDSPEVSFTATLALYSLSSGAKDVLAIILINIRVLWGTHYREHQ